MSKSTQKYGQVTMSAKTSIDSNPKLPLHILRQHKNLDVVSTEKFGKVYDAITTAERGLVHETIKDRRQANKLKADQKEMELDHADTLS